jgi:hypothetical protein
VVAYGSSYWYYNNKVTIPAGANGSSGTACDFNNLLGRDINSQMLHSLELMDRRQSNAHQLALAQNMNFWIKGTLKINGNIVSKKFILGHNGTSDHNWWIGSPDGTRYDSSGNSGMNVQYIDVHSQTHAYCLNQSKNNYSLVVSEGMCSSKTYDERYHGHWKWVGTVIGITLAAIVYTGVCLAVYAEEDPFFCRPVKRVKETIQDLFSTAENGEVETPNYVLKGPRGIYFEYSKEGEVEGYWIDDKDGGPRKFVKGEPKFIPKGDRFYYIEKE